MSRLKQLIQEVHRRSLWQVLLIYIGAGWIVFEIVQTVTEGLDLPQWFPAFAALLLLIGLPIVLATAFVQEGISPSRRHDATLMPGAEPGSEARPREVAGARRLFSWRSAISGGVLALALWGVVAAGWLLFGERAPDTVDARKSIAVLPLDNIGDLDESQAFTDGIHDDILTHLFKIADLKVISRTSVLEYRDTRRNLRQIADELGVGAILEGGVQRSGNRVRINYGEDLTAENVFAIQTDIASAHRVGAQSSGNSR